VAVDLAALARDVQGWTDEYLAEQMLLGESGYADPAAWAILVAEADRRSAAHTVAAHHSPQLQLHLDQSLSPPLASGATRTISDSWTWYYQRSFVLLPALLGLAAALRHIEHLTLFVLVAAVLVAPRSLGRIRLKSVAMDPLFLHVSGFSREAAIPLSDVDRVTQSRSFLARARVVTVHFTHQTPFGRAITFLPSGSSWGWPQVACTRAVSEIEDAARRARGAD
jgi:hypothetical protein